MGLIALFFILTIGSSLVPRGMTQNAATFFVTSPNVFRVGVAEKVIVTMVRSNGDQSVPVKVSLSQPGSSNPFSEDTRDVSIESSEEFEVVIQANNLVGNEGEYQTMVLKAESLNAQYPFVKQTEILVTLQSGYVFVQTDKPIYTPNQDVRIKVMSLDQNMLPSDRQLHVEIINPAGIKVKRLATTRADASGFLSGEYRFHDHPTFGIWNVTAFYGPELNGELGVRSSVSFEVKEYVLPTFSVSIETPRCILSGANSVVSTISAQYVFGKPVIGRFLFKYGVMRDDGTVDELGERQGPLSEDGRAEVTLDDLTNDFGRRDWFREFQGRRFHVKAIVRETATQFSEAGISTEAVFVSSPYKFSTERTVQYFKAGLSLQVKLDLTFANGDVASGVPVDITAYAIYSDAREEQLEGVFVGGNQVDQISNTDARGGISMTHDIQSDVVTVRIEASTRDPNFEEENQAFIIFEVSGAASDNGDDYIIIRPQNADDRSLIVGVNTNFLIQRVGSTGHENTDLHFLCVTGGKIVKQGVKRNLAAGGTNLDILIESDMAPQMRFIVYYVTVDGHVIADSMLLGVEEKCRQNPPLSLRILPENLPPALDVYEPHGTIDVEVTAPLDSSVSLLAVDKAVYLLRDKDRMNRRKMYDRMKSYDTGCGPGGGQNSAQIFKDSGLTVLTNGDLEVSEREHIGCESEAARKRRSVSGIRCLAEFTSCLESRPRLRDMLLDPDTDWSCQRRGYMLKRNCGISDEIKRAYITCCLNPEPELSNTARSGGNDNQISGVRVREDFRETWFFDIVTMPEDGSPNLYSVSTPSSITEWHLTAISLSQTQGMCVADDTTVSVYQDFFIQLHLPYSVVRLEQTEIIATIFNYGPSDFEVSVNFTVEEGLCTAENPAIRHVFVESKRASSATFIVRPVEIGEFKITVAAGGSRLQDVVRKTLLVVPQGTLMRKGRSVTLNPGRVMFSDNITVPSPENTLAEGETLYEVNRQFDQMAISLPGDSIPDTESCSVKLIGNLLGTLAASPIEGLEDLVRRPTGCGEQTMIRLAPTLFVYNYLQAVGSDTGDHEERITEYISDGVARELTYRQGNGAYAAWIDRPGSTWLTAFVVKVFSQASQFTRVDPGHVEGSINWLIDTNLQDSGAFHENREVIHKEMIGAVKGDTSMTAYVLISLLESRNLLVPANEKISAAIESATQFLDNQIGTINRVYDKAIVTYALALAGSARAVESNDILWAAKEEDGDGAVSFTPNAANYRAGDQPFWLQRRPSAIEVETSGYALLAQLALRLYQNAGKVALWLSKQQNYDGGFVSTQDTVVALQALAKYTERPQFSTINMDCTLTTGDVPLKRHHIQNDNAKIQEEVDVSQSIGHNLKIDSRGVGVAKANVELRYNTEKSDIETCPFHLNISAVEIPSASMIGQNVKGLRITVCTRYTGDGNTHMSIIDVGLYSGFKPVEHTEPGLTGLKEVVNGSASISSYEAGSRSVIFYLDEIPKEEDLCFTFSAKSDIIVGNVQAAAVHVYDYYDPDLSCTIFYKPGIGSALLSTLCSETECVCSGGSLDFCNVDPCPRRYTLQELESAACETHSSYALKIRIDGTHNETGFRVYDFTVVNPIKTGDEVVTVNAERQLFIDEGCNCPRVKGRNIGETFLLVGQKSLKYTTEQGEERYRYIFGRSTKLEFWPRARRPRNAADFDKLQQFVEAMDPATACSNEN